jgi:Tol biopolymer transport system component/C-terminal processing protease CtpA/Prc
MRKALIILSFLALSYSGLAQTNVSWIRYPSISPDGTQIAFMYKGDIFTVGINGGRAVQLTTHPAHNYNPRWSPDGRWIAFNSSRYGNMDVFIMPAEGGAPRRLTTHSGSENLQGFSPDGKYVYFTANIQRPASFALFPAGWATQLFRVSVEGGRPFLVLPNAMDNVTISRDGSFLVYEDIKGGACQWRKHHTSAVARDVWRFDFATREFTQLTTHANSDRNPVLSQNGQTLYFLSERAGSFNIFSASTDRETEPTQITHHERHPVRFLSISDNGTLCYTFDGQLYVIPPGGQSRQVRIDIFRDTEVARTRFVTGGATEAAFSPNGREVAIVVEGDVYVTSVEFPTTTRITNTPGNERNLTWSPDGRSLAFATERNGNWSIKVARNAAPYEPYFFGSNHIVTEFLIDNPNHQDFQPQFSPDGTELAFIRDRARLYVLNLATGQIRQITDGSRNYGSISYMWSPDGKWFTLTFIGALRHPILDIGLVSAAGGSEIINLTMCGYTKGSPRFAMNGNVILFSSDRFGMRAHASWGSHNDVFGIFTTQEALDRFRMSREDIELDRERQNLIAGSANRRNRTDTIMPDIQLRNIENRIQRLTIHSSDLAGFAMTPDGERLFYLARVEGGFDLWMRNFRNNETRLLERLNVGSGSLRISNDGERLEVFAGGNIFTLNVRDTRTRNNITFRAQVDTDPQARREEMFAHVWRTIAERFYDENMHGADWDGFKRDYARFLPHINNYWCFAELLAEFAGELNASHASVRFTPSDQGVATARTGLFFDMIPTTRGIRVDEVIANGPFDNARSRVRPGHYLVKINGEEILENTDFFALLNGQTGIETTFTFRDGATEFTERNRPISASAENELLYQRWVQAQRDRVDELSGGRLGFVHIRGMNDESYRTIWSEMFGRFNEKEGIIVCVRNNGGGRMHEDIEALFTATKYLEHVARGQKLSHQPTKRWTRPSVMLQNEASYSNAHGTPWVYREMGLGTLIGAPVPGTMTTSGWVTIPVTGGSIRYGKPTAGWVDRHGNFLENQQLEPDILVLNETNILWQNRDQQIEEAVRVLLRKADEYVDPWERFEHRR